MFAITAAWRFVPSVIVCCFLARTPGSSGGSAYLRLLYDLEQGRPPAIDLEGEARLAALLRSLVQGGVVSSAHDLGKGGLAVAVAESAFHRDLGARLEVPGRMVDLFSESQGRALVTVAPEKVDMALRQAEDLGVTALDAGEVAGSALDLRTDEGALRLAVETAHEAWKTGAPESSWAITQR